MSHFAVTLLRILCIVFTTLPFAAAVVAQTYPARPVGIVNPWPAGGAADVVIRLIAEKLSVELG